MTDSIKVTRDDQDIIEDSVVGRSCTKYYKWHSTGATNRKCKCTFDNYAFFSDDGFNMKQMWVPVKPTFDMIE